MEVRIESMICVWDDAIPTMFLEFVNLLTLATSEEGLRKGVKEFAEKHELDKFFHYGFGSPFLPAPTLHEQSRNGDEEQTFISTFLTSKRAMIMATRMTINGVSTCTEVGTEKYERFQSGIGRRRRTLVQYDYRHTDGELFACVKSTLDECREARDKWLNEKAGKEDRR